ncbi:hypothetical protein Vi05172_g1110 [Venturia inaequalis]|nr:hypothetical protein Vi05172_g1110 [Venturia inaequalis]
MHLNLFFLLALATSTMACSSHADCGIDKTGIMGLNCLLCSGKIYGECVFDYKCLSNPTCKCL